MYTISKSLMNVLESQQKEYKKYWHSKFPWYKRAFSGDMLTESKKDSSHKLPQVYMLVGKGNTISNLIHLHGSQENGCGLMPSISQSEFCRAMMVIPEGCQFMGLARVGAFNIKNVKALGYGKNELRSINQNCVYLSLGRNGILLERPVTQSEIHKLKLKVTKDG